MTKSKEQSDSLMPPLDIGLMLKNHVVVICFAEGRAVGVKDALEQAHHANGHVSGLYRGKVYHALGYSLGEDGIQNIVLMSRFVGGLVHTKIYVKGQEIPQAHYHFTSTMDCFLSSMRCNDYRAHCQQIRNINVGTVIDKYGDEHTSEIPHVIPCQVVARSGSFYKIRADHPATLQDQIQAAAVAEGCEWCPRFDPGALRPAGVIDVQVSMKKLSK